MAKRYSKIFAGFSIFVAGFAANKIKKRKLDASLSSPQYLTATDVRQHATIEKRVWTCFGNEVYDITDFVESHPGGIAIMLAAGKAVEPFWDVFTIHKNQQVLEILQTMKIGNITEIERQKLLEISKLLPSAYDTAIKRNLHLNIRSEVPFLGETPLGVVTNTWITPNDLFYVRNHYFVPHVDVSKYSLKVIKNNKIFTSFTLDELKSNFVKHERYVTLQCAGNRKTTMSDHKPTRGIFIDLGFISNAKWGGVYLADVLEKLGINESNCKYIHFEGLDKDINDENPYKVSIPIEIAFDPKHEVLLAFEMNDDVLPADHGFPLRVIVPGVVAARSVKWLHAITASNDPSESFWQKRDYRCFKSNYSNTPPIYNTPVTSAIFHPRSNDTVVLNDKGELTVEGYAYSGGGNGILFVEISIDDGLTWYDCSLDRNVDSSNKNWTWTLWKAKVKLPKNCLKGQGELNIMCRAMDSSFNVQPNSIEFIWNERGFLNNTWHKIKVQLSPNKNT